SKMPAPSLVDLSTRACIKNIRSLTDVGDFEFWKIKTVLARVDSPEQLHRIELASPQIQGEDAELWQTLIRKHIPNWQEKNYAPKNPKKWYEVYCKYKKEQQRKIAEDEEILRNRMMGIKKQKDSMVSKVVDLRNLPKVPRDPRMIANNGGVPLKGKSLFRQEKPSGLNWTSGSKTKMTDGKSVLTRARREAKEIARMSKLSTPTHQLVGRKSQVLKAPAGMAGEYARAAQPAVRILAGKQRKSISSTYSGGISGPNLEERENRLRALTMSATVKPTMVGSSDDEDDFIDDDEADDLFDEKP
ncbi:putative Elongin-A, partial [Halenospora varia]